MFELEYQDELDAMNDLENDERCGIIYTNICFSLLGCSRLIQ